MSNHPPGPSRNALVMREGYRRMLALPLRLAHLLGFAPFRNTARGPDQRARGGPPAGKRVSSVSLRVGQLMDRDDDHPAVRRRERARCKAIFDAAYMAGASNAVAAALAFDTTLSRREAIKLLEQRTFAAAVPRCSGLADRMSAVMAHVPVVSNAGDAAGAMSDNITPAAAGIIVAGERARPSMPLREKEKP